MTEHPNTNKRYNACRQSTNVHRSACKSPFPISTITASIDSTILILHPSANKQCNACCQPTNAQQEPASTSANHCHHAITPSADATEPTPESLEVQRKALWKVPAAKRQHRCTAHAVQPPKHITRHDILRYVWLFTRCSRRTNKLAPARCDPGSRRRAHGRPLAASSQPSYIGKLSGKDLEHKNSRSLENHDSIPPGRAFLSLNRGVQCL